MRSSLHFNQIVTSHIETAKEALAKVKTVPLASATHTTRGSLRKAAQRCKTNHTLGELIIVYYTVTT